MEELNNLSIASDKLKISFANLEGRLNGGVKNEFHKQRKEALQALCEQGLPSTKDENWKYTSLKGVIAHLEKPELIQNFKLDSLSELNLPEQIGERRLVFIDGRYVSKFSSQNLPSGIKFQNLASIKAPLSQKESATFDPTLVINTAFLEDGTELVVESNKVINETIEILNLTFNQNSSHHRLRLNVNQGSSVTVIEHNIGVKNYLATSVVQIECAENSKVTHIFLNRDSHQATRLTTSVVNLAKDATATTYALNFGAQLTRNDLAHKLLGHAASCNLYGLNLLLSDQHLDNSTVIEHVVPNCPSNELYKGVYAERSRGIFSGTIIVHPDAQKTNAFQQNQSILLSEQAESDSRPQLKIWADDVKCTHGATVGQLDETALFYIRSRGVSLAEARAMLIHAFASDVLKTIEPVNLKLKLEKLVSERLEQLA